MNPSASGWIPKYLTLLKQATNSEANNFEAVPYCTLQKNGFIFGVSTTLLFVTPKNRLQLTREETTKVNLLHNLTLLYLVEKKEATPDEIYKTIISFYKAIEKERKGFFIQFSRYKSDASKLERIMTVRIQESNNLFKRDFASLLTHAFLYIDVLAFSKFLDTSILSKKYIANFEKLVMHCCFLALQAKKNKNKYDRLLLELFEDATLYTLPNGNDKPLSYLQTLSLNQNEKLYILDICCLAVWDDHTMEASEQEFLYQLIHQLQLPEESLSNAIQNIIQLTNTNKSKLSLFDHAHPVNQFYKQATQTVKTLILRNKNRLLLELEESGELLVLLGKSTTRSLSSSEKKKVKAQLLDICKTVPSLTIFLLPGGTLLLPLLVKLIPQLLPSAFDENRIDSKK
ncbi:LETM1-related biofilm-associated protein [Rasiella sp. SM2506]|uniref:LETM1-related biofilm-associated protein n=1 Tax=Rasiella sp. SM2506 TaxID=3423914 RepID=UPI003D7905CD